jgi:hypothetical protein
MKNMCAKGEELLKMQGQPPAINAQAPPRAERSPEVPCASVDGRTWLSLAAPTNHAHEAEQPSPEEGERSRLRD